MSAPTVRIKVIKTFSYRDASGEEWGNEYMFTGATPGDGTEWRDLFDALVTAEKPCYDSSVHVVKGYGYDSPDPTVASVWSVLLDTPVAGTCGSAGSAFIAPGDTAGWLRWGLDRRNSKGGPVFLRKYFHGLPIKDNDRDKPSGTWSGNADALGEKLVDGSFIDGRTITDRLGTEVLGHASGPYLTTRTLKRRGKRPT